MRIRVHLPDFNFGMLSASGHLEVACRHISRWGDDLTMEIGDSYTKRTMFRVHRVRGGDDIFGETTEALTLT